MANDVLPQREIPGGHFEAGGGSGGGGGSLTAVSGAADSILCCWDLHSCTHIPSARKGPPHPLEPSSSSSAATMTLQRAAFTPQITLSAASPGCNRLAISADGRALAAAGWDGKVRLFSMVSKKRRTLAVLDYHRCDLICDHDV